METGGVKTDDISPSLALQEPKTLESVEEPTYIDDVDGVPDERQIEWFAFIEGWEKCFPKKAQPRKTNTSLKNKFYARFKDAGFRAKWKSALWVSRDRKFLQSEGWFKAKWFLHNNDNYEKLIDGTFDFKDSGITEEAPKRKIDTGYKIKE